VTSAAPPPPLRIGPAVVALGGGHGLAASLTALRRVTHSLTAVVTVADDGGSSGRLREELGVLPPGDLRMALAALCGDDDWGRTWRDVLQHRFDTDGPLSGHAVGNLLIVALWEQLKDPVTGLDWVARLLGAEGRVLPMAAEPVQIQAQVVGLDPDDPTAFTTVTGQVAVATSEGRVAAVTLLPPEPAVPDDVLTAIREADWVVLGPGSWFTSVIPHLLVPELREAIVTTGARRAVVLNLEDQPGETSGFTPETYLEVLAGHAPELRLDAVIADTTVVVDEHSLADVCATFGAELVIADVAARGVAGVHDPGRLAQVFGTVLGRGRIGPWR